VIKESEGGRSGWPSSGRGVLRRDGPLREGRALRDGPPLGEVRVLSVDKKMFLRKIHDDPSLAFRVMQRMSRRIRELDDELIRVRSVTV